jgi:hypothetical protein
MCGAPERLSALGVRTFLVLCYHNNNGSDSTVGKTVELMWVEYHAAEPVMLWSISMHYSTVCKNCAFLKIRFIYFSWFLYTLHNDLCDWSFFLHLQYMHNISNIK